MEQTTHAAIDRAVALAAAFGKARNARVREDAARKFAVLLATVPDYPSARFSRDDLAGLQSLAELMIGRVEEHVAGDDRNSGRQRELVEAVYAIRRALEEIDRWRRHSAAV